jgi:hypothetical protein
VEKGGSKPQVVAHQVNVILKKRQEISKPVTPKSADYRNDFTGTVVY